MKRTVLSLCLSFMTLLAVQASTLDLLKVDFENGLPSGWTQEYVQLPITQSSNESLYSWAIEEGDSLIYPQGCISGNHRLKAANTTGQEMRFVTRFVSPVLDLSGIYMPQLTFWHAEPARASFSDTLRLYYRTKQVDVWRPLTTKAYTRHTGWQQEIVDLISYNSTYQVAFEITESMGRGVVLDDIVFRSTPTCQNVENIVCSKIHAYDATIMWDNFGAFNEFQLLVADTVLDLQNIDTTRIVGGLQDSVFYDPSAHVHGLKPETVYYVYVRSDCEEVESGWTPWVSSSFRTLKVAYLPYKEDFNQSLALEDNPLYGVPDGWTVNNNLKTTLPFVIRNNTSSAYAPYSIDSTAYLGFTGALSSTPEPIPSSQYVYAVSPEIVAESLQGLQVQFWMTASSFVSLGTKNYAGELIVGTIGDPLDFRTFHPVDTVQVTGTNLFRHVTVNLSDYTGTDKFVALASRAGKPNVVFVDNFTMDKPKVGVPDKVVVNHVSSTGFTVTPSLHGAASWDLVLSTEYSRTGDVSAESVLLQQNNITTAGYAVNQPTLSNQIVHVYTRAHANNSTSAWSFAKTIRVPSAMPVLTDSTSFVLSFEGGNDLNLNQLDQEARIENTFRGTSSLYYTLGAVDQSINTYPMCVGTAPNYSGHGAHMQFCGSDSWFVLPEATDLNTLKMVFRHASLENMRGKLAIGVMTDPYDLSTFTQVAMFEAEGKRYVRRLVSFDEYTGAGKFIAFRSLNAGSGLASSTNLIDEIIVSKLGSCREASNVSVDAHSSYADVTWNGGGMSGWIISMASDNSMMNVLFEETVTTPTVRFNNLEQEKTYYFTIQTICDGVPQDLDDVCYLFTTPRGLPVKEIFSGSMLRWTQSKDKASTIFSGQAFSTTTANWKFSNSSDYVKAPMSGSVAYMTFYSSSGPGWLISPELFVDADPTKPLELVFDLGMATYSSTSSSYTYGEVAPNDVFMVAVSEDGGNTWLRENATVWNNAGTGDYVLNDLIWDGGEKIRIDFSKYIGKHIKFAFYAEGTTSTHHDNVVIDNIILREGDDRCGGLSNLRAYAPNINNANVTWQLAGLNPWPAVVQLSTSANFAVLLANDTIQGTTKSYSGLEPSTAYYVRAHQACTNDGEWKEVTFRTPCTAITPEALGLMNFEDPEALGCWTVGLEVEKSVADLPHRAEVNGFGYVLDMSKTRKDSTASDGAFAILPQLDLDDDVKDISHYQMMFKAGTNDESKDNAHRLLVGIVTDPTDMSATWTKITEINLQYAADSSELKTYVVSFENYRGDLDGYMGHYVVFRAEAGSEYTNYVIIDDVLLTDVEHCHMVLDLEADSTTTAGARMRWTGNGIAYELAVSDKRVDPDTCTAWTFHTVVADTTECFVENLEATTRYYAYIRSFCDDDTSRWSSASFFNTKRGVPYIETFDGDPTTLAKRDFRGYSAVFTGESMTISPSTSSTYWSILETSTYGLTGMEGGAAYMNIWSTNKGYWLITPTMDLTNVTDNRIRFSAKVALCKYSSPYDQPESCNDDRLGILVSRDGGNTWLKKDATFWASDGSGKYAYNFNKTAKRIEVDLSDYVGDSIAIAIYGESTESNVDNRLFVDSVRVEKLPSVCMGVRKASIELTGEASAVARWTINGTPKEVVYELSDEHDFATIMLSDTTAADSVVFDNLESGHTYYVRLHQADCNSGSETLEISTVAAIPFVESFNVATLPADWTIRTGDADAVVAGTAQLQTTTSTTAWAISTKSNGLPANHLEGRLSKQTAFKNMWFISPDVLIPAGSEDVKLVFDVALTATTTAAVPSNIAGQEFRVLVSTDQGQTWSTTQWIFSNSALAYKQLSTISNTGTRIQLPMDAFVGERVRFAFYKNATGTNTSMLHIANVKLGEVGQMCDAPTQVQVADVQFSTAALTWSGVADKAYIVEYSMMEDFTNAKRDTVYGALTDTIKGLRTGTTYFAHVQTLCAAKSVSDFSSTVSFTTDNGLPYINALSSTSSWTRYQSPFADGLAGTRTVITSALKGWRDETGTAILSASHVYCGNSADYVYWLESPSINLSQVDPETIALFMIDLALTNSASENIAPVAADYATSNKFFVAVSTDNGTTYLPANAWEFSGASSAIYSYADIPVGKGNTYRIDFSRFAGQTIRIALVSMAPVSACIHAARVSLDMAASACFGVSNVTISNIDTAAVCKVTPIDNAHHWELAYGLQGTPVDRMARVESDSVVATITGLLLNSTYQVCARSICAEGDTSIWSDMFTFNTPLGIPYQTAFSASLGQWTRYTGDIERVCDGSDHLQAVTTGWTTYSSSTGALGMPHIYCTQSSSVANWLVSPEINLMPQDGSMGIWLSMKAAVTSSSSSTYAPASAPNHTFRILVSTDNGATWQLKNGYVWGADSISADDLYKNIPAGMGKNIHVDLTRFAGQAIRIALVQGSATSGSSCIHIASFELAEYAVPCFGVDNFTVVNDGNIAHCTIADPSTATTAWQYIYGLSGFRPVDSLAQTVTSRQFDIVDLPMSSTIDVYARSICGTADTSAWFGPQTILTPNGVPYAAPLTSTGTSLPVDWTGESWVMGKSSYVWGVNHAAVNTYSTYTRKLVSPEINLYNLNNDVELSFDMALTKWNTSSAPTSTTGQSFEVQISTDGGNSYETLAVWSDEDMDAEYSYAAIPITGERYHVDLSDFIGESIRIAFTTIATVSGADNDIHLRDVLVDTVPSVGGTCPKVRSMNVLETTFHSAKVIFRGKGLTEALQIEYKCLPEESLFPSYPAVRADSDVVVVDGLSSSSRYKMFVRQQCPDSSWGVWAGPFYFNTVECSLVTGVNALEVTNTDAVIQLITQDANAAVGYQACLVPQGESFQISQARTFATNTAHFVQKLPTNAIYDVYARKICEVGDTSEWSGPFSIHTPLGVPYYAALTTDESASTLVDGWTCKGRTSSTAEWASSSYWSMGKASYVWDVKHAAINSYSNREGLLISPVINTGEAASTGFMELSFDLALTKYNTSDVPTNTANQSFDVRVSVDGGATFEEPVAVWSAEPDATYSYNDIPTYGERYYVDISRYVGQSICVGFCAISVSPTGDNDVHIRNVQIDTSLVRCQPVHDLKVTEITLNTAKVSFSYADGGPNGTAYMEVATDHDFTRLVSTELLVDQPEFVLTNIQSSTRYYVRIKTICDRGAESMWTTTNFSTAYGARFYQDFDDVASLSDWTQCTQMTDTVFAHGTMVETGSKWSRKTTHEDIFPTPHPEMNTWSTNTGWLITPAIDLTPNVGQGMMLGFDLALCKYSGGGIPDVAPAQSFYVIVSEDGGETWLSNNKVSWTHSNGDYDYNDLGVTPVRYLLDMTQYAGKRIKIGFCAESKATGADNWIMIDNVDLNVVLSVDYNDTICEFEDYEMHNLYYPAAELNMGDNSFRIISENFDTVTHVNIFVKSLPRIEVSDTICEGEIYSKHDFVPFVATQTGSYNRYFERPGDCDSIVTLHLTVLPKAHIEVFDTLCDGSVFVFKDKSYYHDVIVMDTLTSLLTGCDSIVTYYVTFSADAVMHSESTAVICQGQRYRDELFSETETGTYHETTASVNGCDSIVTLHLYVADANGALYDTVRVEQLPYMFDGREFIPADADKDDYAFKLESVNEGCEPTLYVHVDRGNALSNIAAESLELAPNPVTVGEAIHVITALSGGEFTATVYNAIGQEVYTLNEFTTDLPGLPASGIYMVRISTGKNLYEGKVLVK